MKYALHCPMCGRQFRDNGFTLRCPDGCNSIVRTTYFDKLRPQGVGLWRYINHLPVRSPLSYGDYPAILKSEEYSSMYESEIYLIINGYSPDFNVRMKTCTFKEIEAIVSLKYAEEWGKNITLASVGNTATAFLELGKYVEDTSVVLFVPEKVFDCTFEIERSENVSLVMVKGGYSRATELAQRFARARDGWEYEGGGLNFARRDGLATFAYAFFERFGFVPDMYVQAVGSGTGVIAFYEGMKRLGVMPPSMVIAQNSPFTPIVDSWLQRTEKIPEYPFDPLEAIYAKVLSNKKPLYEHKGGLFDILTETKGQAVSITDSEAKKAGKLFKKTCGFSLFPAAEVAMAVLDKIDLNGKRILINITGSGLDNLKKDFKVRKPKPDYVVEGEEDLEMIE
ncbi:pyridoxal-phosphate dependent enzyme [Geoglobus acetivorans]|uniref:Pyridoxal-phosphate dependent enzyme n=1 Tax=Geoglobus acetivorans TaxID=565033 RepID=A0ABZ3H2M0_GEOAI|nr:pyridoxal-phosphate dependent enzyme [Geoglobus acetivorans]